MLAELQTRTKVNGRRSPSRRRAFTLLEVLLVMALLMMMAGVLVTGAGHLIRGKPLTPEDVFWTAVRETRKAALLSGRDMRLSYVGTEKDRAFVAKARDGAEVRFPLDLTGELDVSFLGTQKGASAILIRGELIETQTLPLVTFYGDGTCSPFRLQIRTGGTARIMDIDPWTCAQMLPAAENSL